MNIGTASKLTQVSAKMIRYYEQVGLIPPASRSDAGYRSYSNDDIHRLQFIRQARDLGFSVTEIAQLLSLWHDSSRHSADVKQLAQQHIEDLQQRMAKLQAMVTTLQSLVACCAGDQRPNCPILAALEQPHSG